MKLKRLLKITVFACLLFSVVSCQNDSPEEVMYSKTSMEQQTEQKLQCLYEMYKDKPIQSLFNTTRATREVLNGECVIGAIQYCGNHFNENISKNEIVDISETRFKETEMATSQE